MKIKETYDYNIAEPYVSYIENGETGDLIDDELQAIDEFIKSLPKCEKGEHAHWDWSDETQEGIDDITGLFSKTVKGTYVILTPELPND